MKNSKHGWDNLRPYAQGDLSRVWVDLRDDDLREVGGYDPLELEGTLQGMGAKMMTWDTDQGPVSVYGSTPTENPMVGLVWTLTANAAMPRWRFQTRFTEEMLQWCGEGYSVLANFKDARNTMQIKWLKKIGFTFIQHHQMDGQTYIEFLRIMK